MTALMPRLALAALVLAASACDSGGTDEADLLGTWNVQSGTGTTFLTVSQSQSLRDPTQPGTGGLVVSGAVSGTLRYFAGYPEDDVLFAYVADALLDFGSPSPRLVLIVSDGGADGSGPGDVAEVVTLRPDGEPDRRFELADFTPPSPYVFSPTAFRVASARFVEPWTTNEVTVTGTLTFPLIPVTAGQEATLSTGTFTRAEAGRLSVTFAEGGVFSQVNQDLTTSTGTWADLGDGTVRVRLGTDTPETYTYAVRGSTLTLSNERTGADTGTEGRLRIFYGLLPGTLTSVRVETTSTFARGAAGDARPASPPPSRAAFSPRPERLLGRL